MDMTTLTESVEIDPSIWERRDLEGVKIGIPREYFIEGLESGVRREIESAIETLKSL